jgi:hypothetical protein
VAERHIEVIRGEIQALLATTTPIEERKERWDTLLTENLNLQTTLDADDRLKE